jgi:hypothetical protein
MARGSDGLHQIVYESWTGIVWATGAATNWTLSTVDIPSNIGPSNPSMVLDHNNHPLGAYKNFANGGDRALRYTCFDGAQGVPGGANGGIVGLDLWRPTIGFSNTYIQLDTTGRPHVAFSQPTDSINIYGELKYATPVGGAGGTWQAESLGVSGQDPSLAIGSDHVPRIAFDGPDGVMYADKPGAAWVVETVAPNQGGSSISMTLSDTNVPVLSFGPGAEEDMYIE